VPNPPEGGEIRIRRGLSLQDVVRRYTVFIDGTPRGLVATRQAKSFPVMAGRHTVQLRIVGTGSSKSDEISVEVQPGQAVHMKTGSITVKQGALLPLALINPDRFAPRPWIQLSLDADRDSDPT
jgi:hypothetical protein